MAAARETAGYVGVACHTGQRIRKLVALCLRLKKRRRPDGLTAATLFQAIRLQPRRFAEVARHRFWPLRRKCPRSGQTTLTTAVDSSVTQVINLARSSGGVAPVEGLGVIR